MSVTVSDFELKNVAVGPDPFRLSDVAARDDVTAIVLLFQRDFHCRNCRRQVQAVADRYDTFREHDALVASILPEPADRTRTWQDRYDLPFPLLADPAAEVGEAYNQPVRFGVLGSLNDLVGRMPVAIILDVHDDTPTIEYTYEGSLPADRPDVDELLEAVRSITSE